MVWSLQRGRHEAVSGRRFRSWRRSVCTECRKSRVVNPFLTFRRELKGSWPVRGGDVVHPSELKNRALVAAAIAHASGFHATAEAFLLLAHDCLDEATELDGEAPVHFLASLLEEP